MRVLVGCESSGMVRAAFRAAGHEAYSCDLLPADDGERDYHLEADVLTVLDRDQTFDLLIAHPPCTYLCNSSVWALTRTPPHPSPGTLYGAPRRVAADEAIAFFNALLSANVPQICIENPIMHGYARDRLVRPYGQIIQPYDFGEDARKATCLWLKGLPPLVSTCRIAPRHVAGRPRWSNQTDGGQNKLTPSPTRWKARAETYPGIARAMATQWGGLSDAPPAGALDESVR